MRPMLGLLQQTFPFQRKERKLYGYIDYSVWPDNWFLKQSKLRILLTVLTLISLVAFLAVFAKVTSPQMNPPMAIPCTEMAVSPTTGWHLGGPMCAERIGFAHSNPVIAYACGANMPDPHQTASIIIWSSHDQAHTWQTHTTPARARVCDLTIDPTNPLDVVFMTISCSTCSASLYRTFDGGQTWTIFPFPVLNSSGSMYSWTYWVWKDSTLFLAPWISGSSLTINRIAVSVAGRQFAWLAQEGMVASIPQDANIAGMYANSTTLYVVWGSRSHCPPICGGVETTNDSGTTWSYLSPTFDHLPVFLSIATLSAENVLYGIVYHSDQASIVWSRDGGNSWAALPPLPLPMVERIIATPDGTLYVGMYTTNLPETGPKNGIYKLSPDTMQWNYVTSFPGDNSWFTVEWDNAGHPVALWGGVSQQQGPNLAHPGLEFHMP